MAGPSLRGSRAGIVVAGLYLLLSGICFAWVYLSASADLGGASQAAFSLLVLMLPWAFLLPETWFSPVTGMVFIAINALILYLLFGGLSLSGRRR